LFAGNYKASNSTSSYTLFEIEVWAFGCYCCLSDSEDDVIKLLMEK